MATLVEKIVTLENEADSIVAQTRAEAKEIEKSAMTEMDVYRLKLAEETDQKVAAYQGEMEEKHRRSVAEAEKELAQALDAIDQIVGEAVKRQIDRIVARFNEL